MERSVTGRDTFVICKALAYAIITIERRPFEYRETSDCNDMKKLLKHLSTENLTVDFYMEEARRHIDEVKYSNIVDLLPALKDLVDKEAKE